MPKLKSFSGDLHLHDSTVDVFDLSQLTETQGTGVISLQNVHFTQADGLNATLLEKMSGSLILRNVTGLQDMAGLRSLKTVDGSIDIETEYPLLNYTLSLLQTVQGSIKISALERADINRNSTSASDVWTCQRLKQKYKDSGIVKGRFSCFIAGQQNTDSDESSATSRRSSIASMMVSILSLILLF